MVKEEKNRKTRHSQPFSCLSSPKRYLWGYQGPASTGPARESHNPKSKVFIFFFPLFWWWWYNQQAEDRENVSVCFYFFLYLFYSLHHLAGNSFTCPKRRRTRKKKISFFFWLHFNSISVRGLFFFFSLEHGRERKRAGHQKGREKEKKSLMTDG